MATRTMQRQPHIFHFWTVLFLFCLTLNGFGQTGDKTPANFKIAFIGDQGLTKESRQVLQLIKDEGADAVLHQGDFDYKHDPAGWENMINSILGENFPYFASIGNHDTKKWSGTTGYQKRLENRCQRLGITWDGEYGIQSSLKYKGIFMILVAPGVKGTGHDAYIKEKLAADKSLWSICSWHKNQKKMQVGGKSNDTGWGVYEESRAGGAIIATAHEHSYSRTHLLSSMEKQTIASTSDTLILTKGKTFAFVSGIAGKSIRDQEQSGDWWASIYTSDQDADFGALFGEFNYNGVENLAHFYFKDIKGRVPDDFWVISNVEGGITPVQEAPAGVATDFILDQNYPNPFNPETTIRFQVPAAGEAELYVTDLRGRRIRTLFKGYAQAGTNSIRWDGRTSAGQMVASGMYLYHLKIAGRTQTKRLTLLK